MSDPLRMEFLMGTGRIALYRLCDTCGTLSLCPVWDGVSCGHSRSDASLCPGHYHAVESKS